MKNHSTGRLGRLFNAVTLESRSLGPVVMKKRNTTDPGLRPSSMTLCDKRRGGFTLIELLVVVLIIGILSAVALPQYTKAVNRARAAEALTNLKSLATAQKVYFMTNGTYTNKLSELDFSLPIKSVNGREYGVTSYYDIYCYTSEYCQASSRLADLPSMEYLLGNDTFWCLCPEKGNSKRCETCSSMGTYVNNRSEGYRYYLINF